MSAIPAALLLLELAATPARAAVPATGHAASPPGASAGAHDRLAGVWGCERDFGSPQACELTMVHREAGWFVRTAAGDTAVAAIDDRLEARVAGGTVRLRPHADGLRGFWVLPAGVVNMQAFATPVWLRRTRCGSGPNEECFAGTVEGLADRLRFYLDIAPAGDSVRRAFVREPEHNVGASFGTLGVVERGDTLVFTGRRGRVMMHGRRVRGATPAADTLRLVLDRFGLELDLTRRGRDDAAGFYPRPRADAVYRARRPQAVPDGWRVGTPREAGLDEAVIRALVQAVIDSTPDGWASPALHSILIARHGVLAVDEYFCGYTSNDPHDLRSAGKSFGSALAGAEVGRGHLSLDTPVFEAMADSAGVRPADARKAAITLRHLLSMSSGLDCDDDDDTTPGNEDRMQSQHETDDWWRYAWSVPTVRAPGEKAVYCSGAFNLAGAVLARRTGEWLPEVFERDLAGPLGFRRYHLNLMPSGQGYLAGGLWLRPRDFAKLAQLYLDRGMWRGRRVIGAAWVDSSLAPHASLHEPDDYGLGWWRITLHAAGRDYAAFHASGNGGQMAVAIPELDLVVAFTAGNFGDYTTWRRFLDDWIPRLVVPAAARGQAGSGATE